MCLVRSLIFLPFVRLVVLLFLIRRGRLSCWVLGLTVSSHETLLSCHRPVTLGLHSVVLPLEHVRLSDICWILIQMVEWTRLVASLCSFRRLLLFLLQNWVVSFVDCCVVVSFHSSGGLQMWLPIPKGPLSALVCNYRPISITPVLSKVFERLIALRFGRFLESSGVLPSHQYSYRKRLGTCDALLDIVCAGQLELDRGGEIALVQIDFSAAFDRVNHGGLVFKLREAGVGGLILRVFQNFCPVVLRELRLMVCLVQVLMSYLVCHNVVFLVHCCFCCTLLTFLGCFRMSWLVMWTTLPCFVGYHILVIGHPWQHRWMMIWLWSAIGAVGGAC